MDFDMVIDFLEIGRDVWNSELGTLLVGLATFAIIFSLTKRLIYK